MEVDTLPQSIPIAQPQNNIPGEPKRLRNWSSQQNHGLFLARFTNFSIPLLDILERNGHPLTYVCCVKKKSAIATFFRNRYRGCVVVLPMPFALATFDVLGSSRAVCSLTILRG